MRPFCVLINEPVKPSSRRTSSAALNTALNLHKRHFTQFSSLSLSLPPFFFNHLKFVCSAAAAGCQSAGRTRTYLSHTLTFKLSAHVEA